MFFQSSIIDFHFLKKFNQFFLQGIIWIIQDLKKILKMEDNIIKDTRDRFRPKREKNEIDHTAIKGKRNLFKLKKKMKQLI